MSSAAGLSAAKRRRGAGSSTTTSVPQQSSNVKTSQTKVRAGSGVPAGMPPIGQVLYVHEERLRRLEKLTGDLDDNDNAEGSASDNRIDREEFVNVVQMINTELGKMKQMVSDLQSNVLSNATAIRNAKESVTSKDDVTASVVADVAAELNNVTLTVAESGEGGKKKKGSTSDS